MQVIIILKDCLTVTAFRNGDKITVTSEGEGLFEVESADGLEIVK